MFILSIYEGLTDLPSRLPTQSSTLYANNISKFLLSITDDKDKDPSFYINLNDEVIRGSILAKDAEILWPPPPPPKLDQPTATIAKSSAPTVVVPKERNYFQET